MTNDISLAKSSNAVKNGTSVSACQRTGQYNTYNQYVKNTPSFDDIKNKYNNRFYNGIFVQLVGDQTIVGA